jgi:hypothetical protein
VFHPGRHHPREGPAKASSEILNSATVLQTTDPASETIWTAGAPVTLTPPPANEVVSGASLGI